MANVHGFRNGNNDRNNGNGPNQGFQNIDPAAA